MIEPDATQRRRMAAHRDEAERRCAHQRVLLAQIEATGQDTAEAHSLLEQFEQSLALMAHTANRDKGRV